MVSYSFFTTLETLCKLANDTIKNDLKLFETSSLITTHLLNSMLLGSQVNNTLEELIHAMQSEFERVNNIFRLIFQANQYFAGITYNGRVSVSAVQYDPNLKVKLIKSKIF